MDAKLNVLGEELAARWQEALDAGVQPMVVLQTTHVACLRIVKLSDLKRHAVNLV